MLVGICTVGGVGVVGVCMLSVFVGVSTLVGVGAVVGVNAVVGATKIGFAIKDISVKLYILLPNLLRVSRSITLNVRRPTSGNSGDAIDTLQ